MAGWKGKNRRLVGTKGEKTQKIKPEERDRRGGKKNAKTTTAAVRGLIHLEDHLISSEEDKTSTLKLDGKHSAKRKGRRSIRVGNPQLSE